MKPELSPPALTREHSTELERLGVEAHKALAAAASAINDSLHRYREAGERLAKVKASLGHGRWLPWLKAHDIHPRKASRALRVYARWDEIGQKANLNEALACLAEPREEREIPQALPPPGAGDAWEPPQITCRPCRVGGAKPGCKDCKALRKQPQAPPTPNGRPTNGKPSGNGKPVFSIKIITEPLGKAMAGVDEMLHHFGLEREPVRKGEARPAEHTPESLEIFRLTRQADDCLRRAYELATAYRAKLAKAARDNDGPGQR